MKKAASPADLLQVGRALTIAERREPQVTTGVFEVARRLGVGAKQPPVAGEHVVKIAEAQTCGLFGAGHGVGVLPSNV